MSATAPAAATTGQYLGTTVAAMSSETEPGFWLKTPLVSSPTRGRVENPATGQTVNVTLIPRMGPKTALSLTSKATLEKLGAPSKSRPNLKVYVGGW